VKSTQKQQKKLLALLKGSAKYPKINPPANGCWSVDELAAIAWVVQDFVNLNDEVIECDPIKDWLEEYKFFAASRKVG